MASRAVKRNRAALRSPRRRPPWPCVGAEGAHRAHQRGSCAVGMTLNARSRSLRSAPRRRDDGAVDGSHVTRHDGLHCGDDVGGHHDWIDRQGTAWAPWLPRPVVLIVIRSAVAIMGPGLTPMVPGFMVWPVVHAVHSPYQKTIEEAVSIMTRARELPLRPAGRSAQPCHRRRRAWPRVKGKAAPTSASW